ncbi:MAG: metal ABC transporter substrate-binding protein [Epsilonproteobacteria bacterium (ex Lamellibrachia satsuma)]|nr:MAG: metal ABC transporter substrate-binding protein [Epsilonproteobacteria bacterium (ex Lamellibrachia satsuma)]
MKKTTLLLSLLSTVVFAQFNVVASYPYLGRIVKAVGGDNVKVKVLASPRFDPHFVIPKPSLIPAIARADMLVANGAGLEIGWLPPLLKSANNPKVRISSTGFVDASHAIRLIDKPKAVSRAYGDVHPEGNPHFNSDPHNIIPIAKYVTKKLSQLDISHAQEYHHNLTQFATKWKRFLKTFDAQMKTCKSKKVVQYHELYNYLLKRYGIRSTATIEPLPGIAPSSKHTIALIQKMKKENIKMILQDPYHEKKTAHFIAAKTGAKVTVIPHDVGAVSGTDTLKTFYETIATRLCH